MAKERERNKIETIFFKLKRRENFALSCITYFVSVGMTWICTQEKC